MIFFFIIKHWCLYTRTFFEVWNSWNLFCCRLICLLVLFCSFVLISHNLNNQDSPASVKMLTISFNQFQYGQLFKTVCKHMGRIYRSHTSLFTFDQSNKWLRSTCCCLSLCMAIKTSWKPARRVKYIGISIKCHQFEPVSFQYSRHWKNALSEH